MMIQCPFCHATHVVNTIFCNECGNYLLKDENRQTDPLEDVEKNMDETDQMDTSKNQPGFVSYLQQDTKPQSIKLRIGDKERDVEVSLERAILLGRVDPATNVFPEIDLSDNGVLAKSISRRHAQISRHREVVTIEDLASVNGTYINGKKLSPYLPEPVKDGDTLHLGKLAIQIKIKRRQRN